MSSRQDFPPEIFENIAGHLFTDGAYRTCADVNASSKVAYAGTLRVLWHTIDWSIGLRNVPRTKAASRQYDHKEPETKYEVKALLWMLECSDFPGAKYIRYFRLPRGAGITGSYAIKANFPFLPNMKAIIRSGSKRRTPTNDLIDIATGFEFGTCDWQNLVLEAATKDPETYRRAEHLIRYGPWELQRPLKGAGFFIDYSRLPEGKLVDIRDVFNDTWTMVHYISESNGGGENRRKRMLPSNLSIKGVTIRDAAALIRMFLDAIKENIYYATMHLVIRCSNEESIGDDEAFIALAELRHEALDTFAAGLHHLHVADLGSLEIKVPTQSLFAARVKLETAENSKLYLTLTWSNADEEFLENRVLHPSESPNEVFEDDEIDPDAPDPFDHPLRAEWDECPSDEDKFADIDTVIKMDRKLAIALADIHDPGCTGPGLESPSPEPGFNDDVLNNVTGW